METGISCIMYFHGYRSYQKRRFKNKYGKYLMGMLVVTALVEELRVTPGKISIVVSTVIPLPKSSTKNSVSEASVASAGALEYREKSSSKNGRDGSGGCAGTGASL